MALAQLTVRVKGLTPLLMHNLRLADPLDPIVKEKKKLTGKGPKKTDSDHDELGDLEWLGGLYVNDAGQPIFPADNIQGALIATAPAVRKGLRDLMKAAVYAEKDAVIEHDGPKTIDGLKGDPRFRLRKPMKQDRKVIIRTRPRFMPWGLTFTLKIDTNVVDVSDVEQTIRAVSERSGFGDQRPRYGRFEILSMKKS